MGLQGPNNSNPEPMSTSRDIAIIGTSCRLPCANSMDEFWKILINNVDTISPVPPERTFMTGTKELHGGFLKCPINEFDAGFFNYSATEAQFLDPQLRLYLEVTWEALENAGIIPSSLSQKNTGIYVGVGSSHYKELYAKYFNDKTRFYGFMGNEWSAFAGKLAQLLNIHGPCKTLESACSSAGQALYEAVEDLRNGKIEIGLVSGLNVILMRQLSLPELLFSPSCKVFDESADGFAPSEAIVTVVVKRLENAIQDNDNILAVIKGVGLNHNGTAKSFGTPNPVAITEVMNTALLDAKLDSREITFLEAHGTGTRVGDPLEARSIVQVFGQNPTRRTQPLLIGSVKTNLGHTLMASGIVSLLKVILCLKYRTIPKHLHFKHMNPSIHFDRIPGIVPLKSTPWIANSNLKDEPLRAMFNNFGITGVNVSMVIEEWKRETQTGAIAKEQQQIQNSPPKYSILMFSTKHPQALSTMANFYKEKLISKSDPEISLSDLAHSLLATRESQFQYRAALVAKDKDECIRKLDNHSYETNQLMNENSPDSSDPIIFLFSGQGSTYFGMGKELYFTCPIFKNAFDYGDSLFQKHNHNQTAGDGPTFSFKEALWENEENFKKLGPTVIQPALYTIQYALYKVWTELFGVWPNNCILIGHSIGEYAAAVAAGIMTFENGLYLIVKRANLIEQKLHQVGGMMAIETSVQTVKIYVEKFLSTFFSSDDIDKWIDISCQNSSNQTVASGPKIILEKFKDYLTLNNCDFKKKILNTTHAFHSRAMDPILAEYKKILDESQIVFTKPKTNCKFISTVLGLEISDSETLGNSYWIKNLRDPVLFSQGIENVRQANYFIEIGPQPILLSLLSPTTTTTQTQTLKFLCPSIRKSEPSSWKTLLTSLAKIYTQWNGKINVIGNNELLKQFSGMKINLPNYPFQRKKYWMEIPVENIEMENFENPLQFQPQNIMSKSSTSTIHPFIGKKLSIMSGSRVTIYNNYLTTTTRSSLIIWIKDHNVADLVIVPIACFIESLLGIGKEIFDQGQGGPLVLVLQNITAKKAIVITEEPKQFQTLIISNSEGREVEVTGANKEIPELSSWTHNFTGTICTSSVPDYDCDDVLDLNFIDQIPSIDSTEFYETAYRGGLKYGPNFRVVTKFWLLENQVIGQVKNVGIEEDAFKYTIHPRILDGLLHVVIFVLGQRDQKAGSGFILRLPLHFEKIKWYGIKHKNRLTENLYISTYTKSTDTKLYNENGNIICCLQVTFGETTPERFFQANSPVNETEKLPGFYEESWIPMPVQQSKNQENDEKFNWLIVSPAEQRTIAKELQNLIVESSYQKSKVLICYPEGRNEDSSKNEILIDFTNLTNFQKLRVSFGYEEINGIINLWGLGTCPTAQSRDLATIATLNTIKFGLTMLNPPIQRMCLAVQNALDLADRDLELGSSNPNSSVLVGMMKTFISEYPGVATSILNFDSRKELENSDSFAFASEIYKKLQVLGQETQYYLRDNKTFVPRLTAYPMSKHKLPPPDQLLVSPLKKFRIQTVSTSTSNSKITKEFRFTEMKECDGQGACIRIKASGLNFRDLIVYRSSLLDSRGFKFGCEYSGIIEEVEESWSKLTGFNAGDRVCGVSNGNTFGSHIYIENTTHGNNLMHLPDWMSFNQGATLPIVFLTTFESLVQLAQLSPGEKVLVHNGSGGVGLAGIQIAKYLGAQVFCTAGTIKKRNYLKRVLGIKYVYDSRSISFASEILRDTNGTGVDVVLNTLTSPGFKEASLSVLVQTNLDTSKRFIELSKLNIWTQDELQALRPDVQYFIYDINLELINESSTKELEKLFNASAISPLPYESFKIQELDVALKKFQIGNHIGKFIIEMASSRTLFHPENCYLITGGLGGIGLNVASWIIEEGGENIILTGRNPPTSPNVLKKLKTFGNKVKVILADISEENSVKNLLKEVGPNLKGIFHAAGVFPDSVLVNQTFESFRSAYKPKVDGTWNLHNQTIELGLNLDYFVVFSSIASIVGSPGQGSYTAANQFLDSFTHYRLNELGLPCLSINYGGWQDVGITERLHYTPENIKQLTQRTGVGFFRPADGIRGLDKAIRLRLKQITIANIDIEGIGKTVLPKLREYTSKLSTLNNKLNINPNQFSSNQNNYNSNNTISKLAKSIVKGQKDLSKAELEKSVGSLVTECFKLYMGMDEEFDSNTSTFLLGMDSLMSMEIINRLNKELSITLSRKRFQDSKTPAEITNYLVEILTSE